MKIFIDTSAFIAIFVTKEKLHKDCVAKYTEYKNERAQLFTSLFILNELFTRLVYYFNKNSAEKIVKKLQDSISKEEINILPIDEVLFKKSAETLIKFFDQKVSLTDATTYHLFKDFALDEIFTLDSDFKKLRLPTSF